MNPLLSTHVPAVWQWVTSSFLVIILAWFEVMIVRSKLTIPSLRKGIVILTLIVVVSALSYQVYTWWFYHQTAVGRELLPPHSFFFYRQLGAALSNLLSGFVAAVIVLMFGLWARRQNKLDQFGLDDWLILTGGTIAVGWPAVFIFLAIIFLSTVFGMITLVLFKKKSLTDRLVVTPFIIPSAILTLFFGSYLLAWTHLDKIRF